VARKASVMGKECSDLQRLNLLVAGMSRRSISSNGMFAVRGVYPAECETSQTRRLIGLALLRIRSVKQGGGLGTQQGKRRIGPGTDGIRLLLALIGLASLLMLLYFGGWLGEAYQWIINHLPG